MYFADLGNATQIASGEHVRAVGWLSSAHDFPRGESPPEFASQLRAVCQRWGEGLEALWWPAAGGPHQCELCQSFRASGNVGVPSGDILYVAPEMVSHYVESHSYAPPAGFVEAVLRCPLPGTDAYASAVARFKELHRAQYAARFGEG